MSGRKGFTLVELLIVIVVIGVLAAMMMLSSTEAISSAKASNIVAGLTTFKEALIHWYTDNYDKVVIGYYDKEKYVKDDIYRITYTKNNKTIHTLGDMMANDPGAVTKYIGNASQFKFDNTSFSSKATEGKYRFEDSGAANKRSSWFVGYVLSASEKNSGVAQKLVGRAKSAHLLANQGTTGGTNVGSNQAEITPYAGGDIVWMKVLDFK